MPDKLSYHICMCLILMPIVFVKTEKATPTALKLKLPIYIDKHADIDINNQFSILLTNLLLTSNVESESTYNITSTSVNRTLNSNFQRFFSDRIA